MGPIDQPLIILELLGRRSPAPAQDVARRILGRRWWAGFTFNGITAYGDGHDSLIGGDALSDGERDALLELCRQRLDAFREQRGEEVFAHRSRHRSPISGSEKPGRLRRHHQRAGPLLPLQRRQARRLFAVARGRTDFRGVQASYGHREAGCVFCALEGSGQVLLENEGHSLVIPRRHGADGLELHQPEWNAVVEPLKLRRERLSAEDASISGWAGLLNARGGLNSGEAAGQTVFHAHWHLIPRREVDCQQPHSTDEVGRDTNTRLTRSP
ncbi:HIT family protein [Cyanobium sp. Candia 9D4]|uniref:HIT family protein n=1 Tax=Cyanobium sp. Candia 9D4 TaxID=2823707 RepID=UPI0020CD9129|nr:HIT family protein [Cyanobium sp. Candia 9D4]MCP9934008.1 HIT family protein [Cyanobium sp. Candia 9D4]